jgi:hypothetical protein
LIDEPRHLLTYLPAPHPGRRRLSRGLIAPLGLMAALCLLAVGCGDTDRTTGPADDDLPQPDPPVTAFEEREGTSWTTHDEELAFLAEVVAASGRAEMSAIGTSIEGRPLHLVRVAHPTPPTDAQIAGGRSILVIGAQHGNEPAGREMALQLLRDLAFTSDPELVELLGTTTLLFIPTANPDGREADSRTNAHGVDTNRDHLRLLTPEARAMARVLRDFTPDIVVDTHERPGGTNPEMELLWPRNLNIHGPVRDLSREMVEDYLFPDLAGAGRTRGLYGPSPGPPGDDNEHILRNATGLRHSLGLLTESAGQRPPADRVAVQMETMHSVLRFYRERASEIGHAVGTAPGAKALAGGQREPFFLRGADNDPPDPVDTLDPAPCGYLLHAEQAGLLARQVELLPLRTETVSATGVFLPMDQPLMTFVPLLVDARARGALVGAFPLTSDTECADPGSVEPPEPPPSTGPAQHQTDFSGATTGEPPLGWSVEWRDSDWQVVGTPPVLRHVVDAAGGRRALAWSVPGDGGLVHGDVEVFGVVRVEAPMPQTRFQLAVHLSGEAGSESAFYLDTRSDGTVRLNRYQSGTFGTLSSASLPFAVEAGAWYRVVLRYRGHTLSGKVWPDGSAEPEGWQVETTSTLFGNGRIGLAHFSPGAVNEWAWVSVGTGGEPAPRRP